MMRCLLLIFCMHECPDVLLNFVVEEGEVIPNDKSATLVHRLQLCFIGRGTVFWAMQLGTLLQAQRLPHRSLDPICRNSTSLHSKLARRRWRPCHAEDRSDGDSISGSSSSSNSSSSSDGGRGGRNNFYMGTLTLHADCRCLLCIRRACLLICWCMNDVVGGPPMCCR